ncbi:MAG: hypothetical protein IT165_34060 [Bryobacterales bacterium]|nr:hypothetical protein [Bryobacterales bacterium]
MYRWFVVLVLALTIAGCGRKAAQEAGSTQPVAAEQQQPAAQQPAAQAPAAQVPTSQTAEPPSRQTAAAVPAKPLPPPPVTLPAGTVLRVRTTTTLSSKNSQTGDRFTATLTEPLVAGGKVLAPRGAQVEGLIADSNQGGRVKGRAHISIRLTSVDVNGRQMAVSTGAFTRTARATKKKDATKIGIGSGIGAVIGAIAGGGRGAAIGAAAGAGAGTGVVLGTRGEPAVIPSESVLTFRLRNPVTVASPQTRG